MTELDKLLRSTEAMTELDRLLHEIEARQKAGKKWNDASLGCDCAICLSLADVPKLVKALRRAMGTLCGCSVTLAEIEAILKEKP